MSDTITIPRATYKALIERLEDLEDQMLADRHRHDERVPASLVDRILDGEHPVKVWREHRGLSEDDLADAAGLSIEMIADVESRAGIPSLPAAQAIAAALRLGLDDLFPDPPAATAARSDP